jgi:hypothetical protein
MKNFALIVADYKEIPQHLVVQSEFWIQMLVMFGSKICVTRAYFGLN